MHKLIPKDKTVRLCKGLTSQEMACQCNYDECRATIVSNELVKAFGAFRKLVDVPLIINSGYRCTRHNFWVGGKSCSRHLTGEAVDISLKSINHLSQSDIEFAARRSGFNYILFYKSFVHMDVRKTQEKV